ncbi:tRNA uridine-5-carboxymethylaminomethyl(34) synthesis GTPase MnmE [Parvularcula lutaonensis]|uniref:tRNA modification GTPase MnmE n=1 Tax=Parvularcula lutaonensis TaxID=491923 RepID=A0ABV7MAT6_9PROT|nr:tRNA uridine-5-carboxymethylaminomethyl(34) synthesis GTPase MnmE [Parvularcula lutaonensis]GGY46459.1 tRNA modification GTPase MnmE [Parvularcula lutaonensis]
MSASTIFARASGQGRCGVAVFRISGPLAGQTLEKLTGNLPKPRFAKRVFVRSRQGELIDDGLALWFPAPNSFTGEDVVELQLHGSPAVEARLSDELIALGLEPAGPGAFTTRAFANGKLDLTQAEGLADLLEAETLLQHRQAMAHYRGSLRDQADQWRADLVRAMAKLDAAVDFPDEEDVPGEIAAGAQPFVESVRASIAETVASFSRTRRVSDGVKVALLGPPNAGKSTLFNALVREDRAIVSDEAGTTRDIVSHRVEIGGHLVTFLDMAGVRDETASAVESQGIERARSAAKDADLRLLCFPAGKDPLPEWLAAHSREGDIVVRTKADLVQASDSEAVSVHSPETIERLHGKLVAHLNEVAAPGLAATERQQALLLRALDELDRFEHVAQIAPEMGAEALRAASTRLEELTGRIAPDDILDDIFSSFCIGK